MLGAGAGGGTLLGLLGEELELTLLGDVASVTEALDSNLARRMLLLGDNATSVCLD